MSVNLDNIWQSTLSEISKELTKPSFETWLRSTRPVSVNNGCLVIEAT